MRRRTMPCKLDEPVDAVGANQLVDEDNVRFLLFLLLERHDGLDAVADGHEEEENDT